MITFFRVVIGGCIIVLVSCGGSSGGDGGRPIVTSGSGEEFTGCAVVQDQTDTSDPVAQILFPWKASVSTADEITVRGTATDSSGITSVRVNGVLAELDCDTEYDVAAEWRVTIPMLEKGALDLVVEVRDGAGNVNESAATAKVDSYNFVPSYFLFDADRNRLIAKKTRNQVISMDVETGEYETISTYEPGYGYSFTQMNDSLVHVEPVDEGQWEYLITLRDMGSDELIFEGAFALDPMDDFWPPDGKVVADLINNDLYMYMTFINSEVYELSQTHILKYDLDTQLLSTLSSSEMDLGEPLVMFSDMVFNGDELLVFGWNDTLLSVDLSTGFRTKVSDPVDVTGLSLAVDPAGDFAYVTGFDGLAKVDLKSGLVDIISPEVNEDVFNFSYIGSTAVDVANERVLVGDSSFDTIFGVDINTGQRSIVLSNGVGKGKKMAAPRNVVLDEENNQLFVADDGENAPETLFLIDLESGDRSVFADMEQTSNVFVNGLELDIQNNRFLVAFDRKIIQVDRDTRLVSDISSESVGLGPNFEMIRAMVLDIDNNRVLLTDWSLDAVMAVDLASGDRTIISKFEEAGEGAPFDGPFGIDLDVRNNIAYVTDLGNGTLRSVDLKTGDRKTLLTECINERGVNLFDDNFQGIRGITFDEVTATIWISAGSLVKYHLGNDQCTITGVAAPLNIEISNSGFLFGGSFGSAVYIDPEVGQQVIISK